MAIVLSALFAVAALAAVLTIWHAVASNVQTMLELRRRVSAPHYANEIVVTLRDPSIEPVASMRRPRQARHPLPKPMTHRLHHYDKSRSVA